MIISFILTVINIGFTILLIRELLRAEKALNEEVNEHYRDLLRHVEYLEKISGLKECVQSFPCMSQAELRQYLTENRMAYLITDSSFVQVVTGVNTIEFWRK